MRVFCFLFPVFPDYSEQFYQLVYTFNYCKVSQYGKVPKFSDARKLCCNLPKIQTKGTKLKLFHQKDVNGIANSEDPDQTAPLGAV